MSKHDTILLTGTPGSGTSQLGESLAEYLNSPLQSVEHVSLSDRVRAIGRGAVESLYGTHIARHLASRHPEDLMDDNIVKGVVEEIFDEHRDTSLLLLDSYPRTPDQISDAFSAARRYRRLIRGAIMTHTDELTATTRMLGRTQHPVTLEVARTKLDTYQISEPDILRVFGERGLLLAQIDTTGEKADTTEEGLRALATMVGSALVETT